MVHQILKYKLLFDYLQSMKLVLKYDTKVKLYADDIDYDKIISFVVRQFSLLKDSICLTFNDQQGDNITLLSNQDIQIMQAVFQGSEYVKVNIEGVPVDFKGSQLSEEKSDQPLKINESIAQSQRQNIEAEKKFIIQSGQEVPQERKFQKKQYHKGQRDCGERRRQKFAKMSCYMNELVAKLVDQRIKVLLPCLKQQISNNGQKIQIKTEISHEGYQCKGCLATPITGIRYECPKCPNFNLCRNCQEKIQHDHNLLKIKKTEPKDQQKHFSTWQNCFRKFFENHRDRSSSHNKRNHHHRWGGHYMRKISGLSYIFGGLPDDYRNFVQKNHGLKPRQTFKKYAKLVNMPDDQFTKKYVSLRCQKLSKCFGKPAETYRTFVEEHIQLRQRDMMEVLYEKGIEKRQNNKECQWGGRKYKFNDHCQKQQQKNYLKQQCKDKKNVEDTKVSEENIECKEKKEKKQKKQGKGLNEESPKPRQKIFCFKQEKQQQKIQISESMLREPKPLDKPAVAKVKGAIFLNMTELFPQADKKQLVKFIDQHYLQDNQDYIIDKWVKQAWIE